MGQHEKLICRLCEHELPKCRFMDLQNNALARQFWGRVRLDQVSAFCFHTGKGVFPNLLHQLKYKSHPELAEYLGARFAAEALNLSDWNEADALIPVPLHPSKKRKRGYNQSEKISIGLSKMLNVPVDMGVLFRRSRGNTQTRKSRFLRSSDSRRVFWVDEKVRREWSHVVLVDDVVTTGATIEACANALRKRYPQLRISLLSLAYTWS